MTALKTIRVHGALAKLLKRRTFKAAVRSPQEAVAFLLANFPETEAYMRPRFFHIRAGGREIYQEDIDSPTGVYEEICITPAICGAGGSGVGSIIGGAFLIAAAIFVPFAAPVLLPLGIGLALTGVAQVLTPVPSDRPESTDSGRRDSYNFSGLQQTSREGIPVPLVYGEIMTGSVVLSVGIDEDDEELDPDFAGGAGNPNPDQNPVPDPDSGSGTGSGFANVAQTSGWTHCRFRIKPGSINGDFEIRYHNPTNTQIQYTGYIQNNPDNWLCCQEPYQLRSTQVNGDTYYWYRDVFTANTRSMWNVHLAEYPGFNHGFASVDPAFDGTEAIIEFYTGSVTFTELINHNNLFYTGVFARTLNRPNPPWEQLPGVGSIGSASGGHTNNYWLNDAVDNNDDLFTSGFEFELWVPDVINAQGGTKPYILDGSTRTRWRDDGEGGTWMSVNESWNGGVAGGGLETAPWLR